MNSNLVKNQRFIKQTDTLQEKLPDYYFAGVLLSYVVNAAFVGLFLYPTLLKLLGNIAGLSLAATGAAAVQYMRFLIVFTPLLHYSNKNKLWVKLIAAIFTVAAMVEAYHLLNAFDIPDSEFWSLFLFVGSIICAGWVLEIFFSAKQYEMFDSLQADKKAKSNGLGKYQINGKSTAKAVIQS